MTGSRPPGIRDTAPNAAAAAETGADPDGWLGRWSRRKRQLEAERRPEAPEPADDRPVAAESAVAPEDAAAPSSGDAPAEEAVLPPIESLDADSDYRAFMTDRVSDELRVAALRKLFRLPQFNVTDGLNDYDEDFTSFKTLGDTRTHDMLREFAREAARAAQKQEQQQEQKQASPPADVALKAAVTDTAAAESGGREPPAAGRSEDRVPDTGGRDSKPVLTAEAEHHEPTSRR